MDNNEFLVKTILKDILKVAKVNLITGEYSFIKKLDTEVERRCLKERTINQYFETTIKEGVIHPSDVSEFKKFINIKHLRQQIEKGKTHFAHSYRRRFNNIYTWITFVLSVPEDYSKDNAWVLFRWEITDDDHHMLEDSLKILSSIFHKILKINITEDSFVIIKGYDDEMNKKQGYDEKISAWLRNFALCGNVHEEDKDAFLKFSNINLLRDHFKKSKEYLRCRYRRKTEGSFRWVSMELVPSIEYSDDNQILMLYIRDIQDEYVAELHYQKELEYQCNTDVLTGLWNRNYYSKYIQHLSRRNVSSIGFLFADLNGLKKVNDQLGHEGGDKFIKQFATILVNSFGKECCCRLSGDEFLVWQEEISKDKFDCKVKKFKDKILVSGKPMASVGTSWSDTNTDPEEFVKDAELTMYADKEQYYVEHQCERR